MEKLLKHIRGRGWFVAIHNDYTLYGKLYTFWLFRKGDLCVKGESANDNTALNQVIKEIERIERGD